MADNFVTDELCAERHRNLERTMEGAEKKIDTLFARLNWFYILVIATLVAVIGQYFQG